MRETSALKAGRIQLSNLTHMKFYIVDVFGEEKYSGNQLAVVIADKTVIPSSMQQIANEFHFSETTFVSPEPLGNCEFGASIFTPKNEVPFAGHPTLGTAFIIRSEIIRQKVPWVILQLKVGRIPVSFDDASGLQWMSQIEPAFGLIHDAKAIAALINVSPDDIDTRFPVQNVSTGIGFVLIPLKSLRAIKNASTNMMLYRRYFVHGEPKPLFLFCPETYDSDNSINCRMFADAFGIPEDPATGSANGCLAAYLAKYNYFGSSQIDIRVEQGFEIGRQSILHLHSSHINGEYAVKIGGKVIMIAEGVLVKPNAAAWGGAG